MTASQNLRRGLPRVAGGEPWPVIATVAVTSVVPSQDPSVAVEIAPLSAVAEVAGAEALVAPALSGAVSTGADSIAAATEQAQPATDGIRRGLPRVAGGAPWPVATAAAGTPVQAVRHAERAPVAAAQPSETPPEVMPAPAPLSGQAPLANAAAGAASLRQDPAGKSPATQPAATPAANPTVPHTATPAPAKATAPEAAQGGNPVADLGRGQRVWLVVICAFALFGLASAIVLTARWLIGLDSVAAFVSRFPGEYELPHSAPVGLPAWMGWQHFFNIFFMVLIVRSGLQVRNQKRPPAYWASKRNPQQKISLNLWFHQAIDVFWMANGLIFVILLFTTGQWMRIIPTSWEVFPNALSAGLQYLTLNWPVENGWVNYNSLQQLAYFLTVFIAAPLAVASGVRMSGFWPKNNAKLSAAYPIEVARALHFPTMLYFVAFTVVHVTLVLTTGALRNLNHMYGARDEVSWYGAIMLLVSLAVIVGAAIAARPMVLAPLARMMGNVSAR